MAMSAADYREQLLALLPPGAAWARDPESTLARLLEALGAELARVDARGDDLLAESDPRTTWELLPDWERVADLPSPCMAGQSQTTAERRSALVGRLAERGGQSIAYFVALAASLGYAVTVDEFRPFDVTMDVTAQVADESWVHVWRVNAPANGGVRVADVTMGADDALASWGSALLECAIREDAPAQTTVLFAYA